MLNYNLIKHYILYVSVEKTLWENLMVKKNKLIQSIFAVGILSFLGIVIETALNIAYPRLMINFNVSARTVQWLTTGYMLVSTVIIPFGSFLKKRFKTISLFRVAVFCFLLGTVCAGLTSKFGLLLFGRLLQGVADGIGLPLMFSIILEQAPKNQVGMFMGIGTLVIAFAPAVGPVYGGIILKYLSWQFLFIFIVPLIIATWLLGEFSITQSQMTKKPLFDFKGGIALTGFLLSTLLLILTFTTNTNLVKQLVLAAITLITGLAFAYIENHSDSPILDISLFKNLDFDLFLISFFLLQLMSLSMSFLIPNVLQIAFKQSTATSAILILPAAIIDAVVSAVAGIIYDKVNKNLPIILGTGVICSTFLVMKLLNTSINIMVLGYIIFMVGLGLSYSNIMTLSLSKLNLTVKDDGNVIYMTTQSYSGAIGTALAASIIALEQSKFYIKAVGNLNGFKLNIDILFFFSLIVFFCITVNLFYVSLHMKKSKKDI